MIDTNHWGYQQILREAIQYRILRRMIETTPRARVNGLPKTDTDSDCVWWDALNRLPA